MEELTDRFVEGDRSRVVLVPGNHDVDWPMSKSAMTLVPDDQVPGNLPSELYRADTKYRWNWKTRELFQISDLPKYEQRLDAYWQFFEEFYQDVKDCFG